MATERQAPDAIASSTDLSGAVTDIDDDPDSPDGLWLTATNNNVNTDVRVTFPTPTGDPTVGADLQEFRAYVRQFDTGQTGNPDARIELWENGTIVRAGSDTSVTGAGQVISFTWNANELGTADGSLVECKVVGTKSGGSPSARNSVEVGAIEWNVDYTAGATQYNENHSFTGTGTNSLTKTIAYTKTLTPAATGTNSLTQELTLVKTLASTATGTNSLSREIQLSKTHSGVGTSSLAKGLLYQISPTMTATGTNVLSKGLLFQISPTMTGTGTLSLDREFQLNKSYSGVGTLGTPVKDVDLNYSYSAVGSNVTTKEAQLSRTFSAVGTQTFAKGLAYQQNPTMTATGTLSLTKEAQLNKSYSGVGSLGTPVKDVSLDKNYSAIGSQSLLKQAELTKTQSAVGTSSLAKGLLYELTLTPTAVGSSNVSDTISFLQAPTMTGTGTNVHSQAVTFVESPVMSGIGTLSKIRDFLFNRSYSATGTPSILKYIDPGLFTSVATGATIAQVLAELQYSAGMTGVGTNTFLKTFIPGGGGGEVANTVTQRTLKGNGGDRDIYRLIHIISDGSEETDLVVYDNSEFINDTNKGSLVEVWCMGSAGVMRLEWDQTADSPALSIDAANGIYYDFKSMSGITNPGGAGATGDLVLTTANLDLNDEVTLIIRVNQG